MKKKTIVRVAAIILAFAAVSVFGLFAAENNPQAAEAADTRVAAAEEAEKQGKKDKDAREAETPEKGVDTPTQEKKANGGSQQPEQTVKKPETGTTTGQSVASASTEKPDTDSKSGGTGNAETNETKPAHTHDWKEVYETVSKEVYGDRCKGCTFSTNQVGAMYEHIDADPFDNCGSYATGVVIRIEKVKEFAGYRCSCGATK